MTKTLVDTYLTKIYGKYQYKVIDKQTKNVIAIVFNIFFISSHNKFRNKYLFWSNEKESDFNLIPVQNFDIIYKKLFIDN